MLLYNPTDFNTKITINDFRMPSFQRLTRANIVLNVHMLLSSITSKLACKILSLWEYYTHDSWVKLKLEMAALLTVNYYWLSFRVKSNCHWQPVTT